MLQKLAGTWLLLLALLTAMLVMPPMPAEAATVTQSTGGTLYRSTSSHYADLWSPEWAVPAGHVLQQARFRGNSEAGYDYGYLYGWNGSSWIQIDTRRSGSYDVWVNVPAGITKLKTRITTDGSVIWSPTYVDAPEVLLQMPDPPYIPGKPQLGNTGAAYWQVTVSWNSAGNPAGTTYELWRKTLDASGSVVEDKAIYSGTATSFNTTDQGSGKYYVYRVRAYYNGNWSPFSAETSYWTAPGFSSVTPASGSIALSWPQVRSGLTYRVWWAPSGGSWSNTTTTNLSYTITGLNPAVRYTVAVSPILSEGGTDWWAGGNQLAPLAYAAGTPNFSSVTQTSMQANWPANGNPSGVTYELWYKPSGPFKADGTFDAVHGTHVGVAANSNGVGTYLGGGWNAATHYNTARIGLATEGTDEFLRFTADGSGAWAGATSPWSIKAGKWYRVTASARTSSPTPVDVFAYAIYTGAFNPTLTWNGLKASDGWKTATAVFQADQDRSGRVYLYGSWGTAGTTFDYDNVVVEEFGANPGNDPGSPSVVFASTTATSYNMANLVPGTSYDLMVQALNADGVPAAYSSGAAVTVPAKPATPTGTYGDLGWSNSAGRGWVRLTWSPVQGATGYKVWVWDGNSYRAFDAGNRTYWDTREEKIYPSESTLDSYGDNSVSWDLFRHDRSGLDLRDTPNKLYKKTIGTGYDGSHSYWFRVSAYNSSGDSGYSDGAYIATLPNRTDTAAPTGSVLINGDQMIAGGPSVTLSLSATDSAVANYTQDTADDASGVVSMRFSNDNSNWSDWVPYAQSYAWKLDASTFGKKTVWVQFRDAAGNVSGVMSDDIFYYLVDAQAPQVSLSISGGADVTSSPTVSLEINAKDDLTPADQLMMRFSSDFSAWTGWEKYQPFKNWSVSPGDGTKEVYVQVKDGSGNVGLGYGKINLLYTAGSVQESTGVFWSDSGSAGTAYSNGTPVNARFVNTPQVTVKLNAAGVSSVQYSLDNLRWLAPEPTSAQKVISLPDWDGMKTVYAKLSNGVVYAVRFVLDRTPPVVNASWLGGATITNAGSATILLTASDNLSRAQELQYSLDGGATWKPYAQQIPVTFSGAGYKTVTLLVRDQAGNVTAATLGIFN